MIHEFDPPFFLNSLACNSVIHPVLLGQLLGMENVNDSFGLVIFFAGIACLVGSPIAGRDNFKDVNLHDMFC